MKEKKSLRSIDRFTPLNQLLVQLNPHMAIDIFPYDQNGLKLALFVQLRSYSNSRQLAIRGI